MCYTHRCLVYLLTVVKVPLDAVSAPPFIEIQRSNTSNLIKSDQRPKPPVWKPKADVHASSLTSDFPLLTLLTYFRHAVTVASCREMCRGDTTLYVERGARFDALGH